LATLYLTLISTWDRGQAVPCVYDWSKATIV